MTAHPDLLGSHKSLTNALRVLIIQKISMQMLLLTPYGSHNPKHPSGNTPENALAETLSQREGDAAICEE